MYGPGDQSLKLFVIGFTLMLGYYISLSCWFNNYPLFNDGNPAEAATTLFPYLEIYWPILEQKILYAMEHATNDLFLVKPLVLFLKS